MEIYCTEMKTIEKSKGAHISEVYRPCPEMQMQPVPMLRTTVNGQHMFYI